MPEKDEPTFVFQINADVTDSAGETRSADRAIRVGYTALEAMISAEDWQTESTPVELKLETKTLDGEPQVAEGSVKIYDLQAPDKVHRPPLAGAEPWRYGGEFGGGAGEGEPGQGPVEPEQLAAGQGGGGEGLHHRHQRSGEAVVQAGRGRLSGGAGDAGSVWQEGHRQAAPAGAAAGGHEAGHQDSATAGRAGLGAAAGAGVHGAVGDGLRRRGGRSSRSSTGTRWSSAIGPRPAQTQQQIKLAVTEAMRGGFFVHVTYVRENRAYLQSRKVGVPWKNKDLELKWEHFVSKLQPGQKETWTLAVQSPKSKVQSAEKAVAEMVATLYDESLDAFAPLSWPHRFSVFRED